MNNEGDQVKEETFPQISEICASPLRVPEILDRPSAVPIYPATVYGCDSADQADELLGNPERGFVYQRDGHPNADLLAEKCRLLHRARKAVVTSSGMAATALVMLSQCRAGDHVVVSKHAYGKSISLLKGEGERLGIKASLVDSTDLEQVKKALERPTRFVFVETVSNPRLRVCDLKQLSAVAHQNGARVVVDNTFATPVHCQPLVHGADIVIESMTKFMNGHGDVTMGMVAGNVDDWADIAAGVSTWGFRAPPADCSQVLRGLKTLWVRMQRASQSAGLIATAMEQESAVVSVDYPGLSTHPDHHLVRGLFESKQGDAMPACGAMITLHLETDRDGVNRFFKAASEIPLFPSLGDVSSSFSHPVTTSHRSMSAREREQLGIREGTVRLSVGLEDPKWVVNVIRKGLLGLDLTGAR